MRSNKIQELTLAFVQCEEAENECDKLTQEIEQLRSDPFGALTQPALRESTRIDVPFPTDDDMLAAMLKAKHLDKLDNDDKEKDADKDKGKDMLYLSPLPDNLDPLPSSLKSFIALPEVDYDFDGSEDEEEEEEEDDASLTRIPEPPTSVSAPRHLAIDHLLRSNPSTLRSSTEVVPKVTSGLSLTAPTGSGVCDHEHSRPTLRIPALQISSHRTSRHSSPSPFDPPASATYPQKHIQSIIPDRDTYTRDRGRSFVMADNEPDHMRTQLQELLSNPVSASLPNISHFPSVVPFPAHPSSPPTRSSSSSSQQPAPPGLVTINPSATAAIPLQPHTHNPYSALTVQRPPAISSASSAALALEKERQKAEKERQKEKERQNVEWDQRRQLNPSASSNSLREPGNLHFISSVQSSGTRRDLTNVYGTSTISGASSSLRDAIGSTTSLSHGSGAGSLREPNAYVTSQLHRHQSGAAHGKKRLNLQGLFQVT